MSHLERAIILVIDSGGVGAAPDAAAYGDEGSDTIGHVAQAAGGLHLPNLARMGLANLHKIEGTPALARPEGFYARMAERSAGKDTTTGHWEMTGLITEVAFPTYPKGFPDEIISAFEAAIGKQVLGNKPASGTAILDELGAEHMRTGKPIVYTSADSVFQIACHEEVWPVDELYRISKLAREILRGPHNVSRIIARPFIGEPGAFKRTPRRKDFAVLPNGDTCLTYMQRAGLDVTGVGKIKDIFSGQGVGASHHMDNNLEGLQITKKLLDEGHGRGLIFTNLVDFDMMYGHRNDAAGYARALLELDGYLPELMSAMKDGDVLFITADHGCDPTILTHTDHTREFVPMLAWGKGLASGQDLGARTSFGDLSATCLEGFGIDGAGLCGESFARQLWRN